MMSDIIKLSQVQHAVASLRRLTRSCDLAEALQTVEDELDARIAPNLPLHYKQLREKNGRFKVDYDLEPLRSALNRSSYRPGGKPLLSMSPFACKLDEASDVLGYCDTDSLVAALAALITRVRSLRGRGGRYGAISRGLAQSVAVELVPNDLAWLLVGELSDAAQLAHKELLSLLTTVDEGVTADLARADYWRFSDVEESDESFYDLALRYELVDAAGASLAAVVIAYAPQLSWRQLVAARLGICANSAFDEEEELEEPVRPVKPVATIMPPKRTRARKLKLQTAA